MLRLFNTICVVILIVLVLDLVIPVSGIAPTPGIKPVIPGMHVLIVEETREQRLWPYDAKSMDDFAVENCAKDKGQPEFRIFDVDQDISRSSRDWREAMDDAKKHKEELPWLEIWGTKKPLSAKLPKSEDATLDTLKSHKR